MAGHHESHLIPARGTLEVHGALVTSMVRSAKSQSRRLDFQFKVLSPIFCERWNRIKGLEAVIEKKKKLCSLVKKYS